MKEKYELKDIVHDLVGRYDAVGATHIDDSTLESLKIFMPQLFEIVEAVFRQMPFELERVEWSMLEIGQEKKKWANQFKDLFEYLLYVEPNDNGTTVL